MRKTKYTPETVALIEQILRSTGSDRSAFEAAGISRQLFYYWIRQYPEFALAVNNAREAFRKENSLRYIENAHKQIEKLLESGSHETWESETLKIKIVGGEEVIEGIERSKKQVTRSTPYWVIDRVMGPTREGIDLLAHLFVEGAIADGYRIGVAQFLRRAAPLLADEIKEAITLELEAGTEADP